MAPAQCGERVPPVISVVAAAPSVPRTDKASEVGPGCTLKEGWEFLRQCGGDGPWTGIPFSHSGGPFCRAAHLPRLDLKCCPRHWRLREQSSVMLDRSQEASFHAQDRRVALIRPESKTSKATMREDLRGRPSVHKGPLRSAPRGWPEAPKGAKGPERGPQRCGPLRWRGSPSSLGYEGTQRMARPAHEQCRDRNPRPSTLRALASVVN